MAEPLTRRILLAVAACVAAVLLAGVATVTASAGDRGVVEVEGPDDGDLQAAPHSETIAVYDVDDGWLGEATSGVPTRAELLQHRRIWDVMRMVAPEPYLSMVAELAIFSDGRDGELAAVTPIDEDAATWTLHIDPADTRDADDLAHTLVHEVAHLITLAPSQVIPFLETGARLAHDEGH